MNAVIQLLIVGVIGLWSIGVVFQRLFPALSTAWRQHLALYLKPQHPRLANWIEPSVTAPKCAMACSDCRPSCNSEKPVQWR